MDRLRDTAPGKKEGNRTKLSRLRHKTIPSPSLILQLALETVVAPITVSISNHGTLVECDPSIKSIIINIDKEKNDYIIEDLDDNHLLIKDVMVAQLKSRLDERLKETVPFVEDDSGSERENKK
ncbi:hypothetical protein O1611_g10042 [Lasiodiplodia mahajangana]|uniref:Uncharacterized protein n=1 Tax=Lasiodiplodia mahajangana TaxID=1108764 RepID=A0ACC2J2X1_9PEZI|nr:hypothetical protein O1611_g10042 [Lasiodiplodia mahajangana]